jgi:hypothetical protein
MKLKYQIKLFVTVLSLASNSFADQCTIEALRLKESTTKVTALTNCLRESAGPSNVASIEKMHNSAICEQNAKNGKVELTNKDAYIKKCLDEMHIPK